MKSRKANVLIFVLGLIFASSIIAVSIVEHASRTLKTRASSVCQQELRTQAYSALYASLAVLSEYYEIDKNLYSAKQGWEKPLEDKRIEFDDGTIAEVVISDESGKLPLSDLNATELTAIFEEMEISTNDAQEMASCIIDWSDNNTAALVDGAEQDDYEDDHPKPPNRPIQSFDEFRYIEKVRDVFFDENGEPTEAFKTFRKGISLEHFDRVNLNSASPETLKMMLDIEDKDYEDDLYDALQGKTGMVSDGIVWVKNLAELQERTSAEVPSKRSVYTVQLLKIEITIKRGIGEYYLCAYYANKRTVSAYDKKIKAVYTQQEDRQDTSTGGKMSSSVSTSTLSVKSAYVKTSDSIMCGSTKKTSTSKVVKGDFQIIKIQERGNSQ
ncbi:MAG: general secretion pathway protein GspK [Opitutales bacterium]|nr:general secretion pathway protein GspK [Opitutales bacterium]